MASSSSAKAKDEDNDGDQSQEEDITQKIMDLDQAHSNSVLKDISHSVRHEDLTFENISILLFMT